MTTETSKYDGHTPEPWEMHDSNSWRRIGTPTGTNVCEPIAQRPDNHPDLFFPNGGPSGPDAMLMLDAPTILRERDEARAVVAKLPHTADGVPVVPGSDFVYYSEVSGRMLSVPPTMARYPVGGGRVVDTWCLVWGHEMFPVSDCYSTKEAAEAARDNA